MIHPSFKCSINFLRFLIEAFFGVGASEFGDPFAYAFGNGTAAAGMFVEIRDVGEWCALQ